MTSLNTQAHAPAELHLPPLPWRRVAWVTWRQHRVGLAGMATLLAALAVYLLVTGLTIHHAYVGVTTCRPSGSAACGLMSSSFNSTYWGRAEVTAGLLQAVPALIGAFIGAPVLARELETGTFRFAWTQGFGRARWTAGKLALLAVAVTVAAAAFSQLFSWYYQPFFAEGQQSPLDPALFDLRGVAFAAWTLVAFAIGALAGMLIRRVVPAMAATLAVWAGLGIVTAIYLRPHYLTPLVSRSPNIGAPDFIVSRWYTGSDGKPVSMSVINQVLQTYHPQAKQIGPTTFQGVINPVNWLAQHGYTQWTSYQPPSRFWPFQLIEGGWLLVLSLLLIAATVWLVRRRAA
jgi:ABC-type transport system involved in multi-copper enzyme maturation permease subunit